MESLIARLRGPAPSIPAMRDAAGAIEALQHDRDHARSQYVKAQEKLARIQHEAAAIADALGARGLIDFADDVRMLTKL
jgi:hypothetical protein